MSKSGVELPKILRFLWKASARKKSFVAEIWHNHQRSEQKSTVDSQTQIDEFDALS